MDRCFPSLLVQSLEALLLGAESAPIIDNLNTKPARGVDSECKETHLIRGKRVYVVRAVFWFWIRKRCAGKRDSVGSACEHMYFHLRTPALCFTSSSYPAQFDKPQQV